MKNHAILVKALELETSGRWDEAHLMVQVLSGRDAARVHAYLHRREGDLNNADYWYRRSGEERPNMSLDDEWDELFRRYRDAAD